MGTLKGSHALPRRCAASQAGRLPTQPMAPLLVGIAGGSGSGKSTLAQGVAGALGPGEVVVLAHDAYYHELGHLPPVQRAGRNFDEPAALDNARLCEDLRRVRAGGTITRPNYDFATHTCLPETTPVSASPVVIIEGILVLAIPGLREMLELKVFVETSEGTRSARRMARDMAERGRTRESVLAQYHGITRPMHDLHVEPSRCHADLVISGEDAAAQAVERLVLAIRRALEARIRA